MDTTDIGHLRHTRRLMWVMLVCATATSMAGNIARATAHHNAVDARGSILAAAIPPLALLSLTHLTGMWSRITARGFVYWCFLAAVTCITAAAFRLSFDALRTLAMQYGYGRTDAALFPLILDGLVAVCTLGLVMLSRIESVEGRDIGDAQKEPPGAPQNPRDAAELIRVRIATSDDAADDADSDAASAALIRPVRHGSETQTSASEHQNGAAACDANRFSAPRQDAPAKHAGASLRHDDSEPDAPRISWCTRNAPPQRWPWCIAYSLGPRTKFRAAPWLQKWGSPQARCSASSRPRRNAPRRCDAPHQSIPIIARVSGVSADESTRQPQ